MAEFPLPVRLLHELAEVIRWKLNDAMVWFHRHVTEEYRKPGPRDN